MRRPGGFGGNDPGGVSVLLGNGDGTFQAAQVTTRLGRIPDSIVAGDFTGNGRLDLAVDARPAEFQEQPITQRRELLLGNGDGSFQPAMTYSVGVWPDAIVAGDFSGSGHLDLAVANEDSGTVSVLLGNGDGTFHVQASYEVALGSATMAAGDFTGDGHLDLAVMNAFEHSVSLLLGNGDGTFQPLLPAGNPAGASPFSIVAGDFTGNGLTDVAAVDTGQDAAMLLGNGDGTFQPPLFSAVGQSANDFYDSQAIATGDFNGDGRLDLAVANQNTNTVSVLLGDGDGTFQPQVTYAVGQGPDAIVAGDFTGDGHLDLAVANYFDNTVSVLLGNGDGTFQPQLTYAVGTGPGGIVAGDFSGDGHLDLATANVHPTGYVAGPPGPGTVSVLLGNGHGTFQPQVTYTVGDAPTAIVAGEFSGDGHLDLAVTNLGSSFGFGAGNVSVLLGNGDGTFQPPVAYTVGTAPQAVVAGDFTGDGRLDLAVANTSGNTVSVLRGNGDGTFQPQVVYPVGLGPGSIVVCDFNGDGHLDLATANQGSDDVSVLLGTGDGTFVDAGQLATAPHATPLVADVNGDGTDDVLVVDGHGNILYRQGIPGQPGTFEPPVTVNPPLPDGSNAYASRDIAWLPNTDQGPVLASVDAHDNAISFYAYRDGGFVRLSGSLTDRPAPGADHRGRLERRRLDRPGRPQCRRRLRFRSSSAPR